MSINDYDCHHLLFINFEEKKMINYGREKKGTEISTIAHSN